MGKKGGSSWLTAVKRAFRSPSKDSEKKSSVRQREDQDHEEEEKKREKRRWLFRKSSTHEHQQLPTLVKATTLPASTDATTPEQRHALAVAVATAAAAEAAVATAQAVVEVVRLTRPASNYVRELCAAVVIQTAFRGYLARRALRALKGLVKLQALVRGHNVRKQANMTLRYVQALVRVQTRVRDQRVRLSQDGCSSKSSISCDTNLWEPRHLQEISERKSMTREEASGIADDWDDRPHTLEEIQAMLQSRTESALKREKALSYVFSNQLWRSEKNPSSSASIGEDYEYVDGEEQTAPRWLDRWIASRASWDHNSIRGRRASTDQRDPVKTLEVDTARPYSYAVSATNFRRLHQPQPMSSPLHRAHHHSPATPATAKIRSLQVRSASPRCIREERAFAAAHTLGSYYHYRTAGGMRTAEAIAAAVPNYMAATESAKARLRSQSAPRQRPSTPERERLSVSAKKRLSFPVPDPYCGPGSAGGGYSQNMRSPSFKSACGRLGAASGQRSNVSSCCTDSLAGEVSPSSTTDLRRWLR